MSKSAFFVVALLLSGIAQGQRTPTTRPAITGISHITLYASDIPKSQQFYTSLLGWPQSPAGAESGVHFYANHLQYVELISPPGNQDPADLLDTVAFSTSNADALRKFLAANGVSVPKAVVRGQDGSMNFIVRDPENNKIEFTQAAKHAPQMPKSNTASLSTHIVHVGFVVRDRAATDHFYKDLLGFRLYWQGGQKDGFTDYAAMQVPDGTDWLEYMLTVPATPSRGNLGSANHFAPGVVSVAQTQARLEQRGWKQPVNQHTRIGRDGKWELNLNDPDGTRVEFMEFQPVQAPCCAPFTGPQPTPSSSW